MIRLGFIIISMLFALQTAAQQRPQVFDRWDSTDDGMKTGPAVGEIIPEFVAENQDGTLTSFEDIKGPKGAVILFHRSADW